jgi:hypothetical protein
MAFEKFDHLGMDFWYLVANIDMQIARNTKRVEFFFDDFAHFGMMNGSVGKWICRGLIHLTGVPHSFDQGFRWQWIIVTRVKNEHRRAIGVEIGHGGCFCKQFSRCGGVHFIIGQPIEWGHERVIGSGIQADLSVEVGII